MPGTISSSMVLNLAEGLTFNINTHGARKTSNNLQARLASLFLPGTNLNNEVGFALLLAGQCKEASDK